MITKHIYEIITYIFLADPAGINTNRFYNSQNDFKNKYNKNNFYKENFNIDPQILAEIY